MNDYKFNRVNELLGESVIYEAKKTKIKLSLDDGSKKEIDFDGSLNDAKKKFSGKKVKTIRKSKAGDIIGEAVIVNVEELNEAKELIPFGYFKITYSDGSSKKTEARAKTAEDFKKYLTQDGDTVTDEDDDGKETKKKIIKVEKLDESTETEEKLVFEKPLDIFKWIKKESQALYIKKNNDGKFEGKTSVKSKKGWILIDGITANRAVQIYDKVTDENKAKLDKVSLEKFLSVVWKLSENKVNESEETTFKVNKQLIVSKSLPQYFETMLWSSTDMDSEEPLDKEYDIKDISKELKDSSKKDLLSFAEYCEKNCAKELEEYLEEEGYESFGHDVWLSRNGHGAGFFDRGNGYKALQKASKTLGGVDPMVSKGKIVA